MNVVQNHNNENETQIDQSRLVDNVSNGKSKLNENDNSEIECKDEQNDINSVQEDEWLDILGSGQLLKKVVKTGRPDTRPQRLDVCIVKYVGRHNDKIVDDGHVTINVGDAEVIQGLDLALPLMDIEEEAEIIVGPRFAFGPEGREPDIPPGAQLHYTVTLISSEPEPTLETLPIQQRNEIGNRKKERGNYWYLRKDFTLAIQCYRRALEYLDDNGLEESNTVTEEEIHTLLDDRIKVCNNLAAAQLKIKAFDAALQSVENVLRCQPNNIKALYRKGKILAEKGDIEGGIVYFKKALAIEPDNDQTKNELSHWLDRQKKDIAQQKKLYRKMLGANKPVENRPLSPATDARRWGVLVGCVGAIFSMFIAYKWYKPL